jgi:hypothetical protein
MTNQPNKANDHKTQHASHPWQTIPTEAFQHRSSAQCDEPGNGLIENYVLTHSGQRQIQHATAADGKADLAVNRTSI